MAKREGVWFLAEFDGNYAVLGKVRGHKALDTDVRNKVLGLAWLEVEYKLDFFSPLRPIPMGTHPNGQPIMGIGRESVVTGNHFLLEPCASYVKVANAKALTFLEDMKPFDYQKYDEFIEQALVNIDQQRKAQSPLSFPEAPGQARMPAPAPGAPLDLSKLRM